MNSWSIEETWSFSNRDGEKCCRLKKRRQLYTVPTRQDAYWILFSCFKSPQFLPGIIAESACYSIRGMKCPKNSIDTGPNLHPYAKVGNPKICPQSKQRGLDSSTTRVNIPPYYSWLTCPLQSCYQGVLFLRLHIRRSPIPPTVLSEQSSSDPMSHR